MTVLTVKYSFNAKGTRLALAGAKDLNASYKDLGAVCDSIRYKPVDSALALLDSVAAAKEPILFRRHNKGMGARHELGGRKGRYPKKCAAMVRKVLLNAVSNARSKGYDESSLFVVHASANKTQILRRNPPKGMLYHSDSYGYAAIRHSDVELAKVEIGVAEPLDVKMSARASLTMKKEQRAAEHQKPASVQKKPVSAPKKPAAKKQHPERQQKPEQQKPEPAMAEPAQQAAPAQSNEEKK